MFRQFRLGAARRRIALLLVLLTGAAAVAAGTAQATTAAKASARAQPCDVLARFDDDRFPRRPQIDNRFLPFVPGTQRVYEGDVDGVPHRVTFTVTDLSKEIDDVETLVIWDVDESEGEVVEAELAFFAQDRAGNVWNLGEYPEEFDGGEFVGAPSTWISGEAGAKAGIHMAATPQVRSSFYLQGFAPEIDFLDCASSRSDGPDRDRPGRHVHRRARHRGDEPQRARGRRPDEVPRARRRHRQDRVHGSRQRPESLDLVELNLLDRDELQDARSEARKLDRRGFRFSDVYEETEPVERLDGRRDDD